ncbi:MAG: SRPBCC family protein [Chitinophagales bacterium]
MWKQSHTVITNEITKEQIWKLFADVNQWHTWDAGIEFARMEGPFEKGNHFLLRPKGGPNVTIQLVETTPNQSFCDLTVFPLAKMYGNHTFEDTPQGLRITTTMTVTGPLRFLWRKLVAQKIVDNLPTEMLQQIEAAKKL